MLELGARKYGLVLLTLMFHIPTVRADDSCSDVLRIGLVDTFSSVRSSNLISALDQWLCSEESDRTLSKENISATVPIPGLDVTASGSYDMSKLHDWRRHNCSSNKSFFAESNAESVASAVLSPFAKDAMDAWSACRGASRSANGVSARIGAYSPADGEFTLTIAWTPTVLVRKEPVIKSFLARNTTCEPKDDIPKKGDVIKNITLACKRDSSKRVTVIINTIDNGPLEPSLVLPAIEKAPAMPIWYRDDDKDGLGDPSVTISAAAQPHGYVDNGNDCNDHDADARERNGQGDCIRYVISRSRMDVSHGQDSSRLYASRFPKNAKLKCHWQTGITPVRLNPDRTVWGDWTFHANDFVYKASTGGASVPVPKSVDFDLQTTADANGDVQAWVHADRCTGNGDVACALEGFTLTLVAQ